MTDLPPVIVAPSILASDFSKLGIEVARMESAGADWIHCDVMDGHFVDNISFGPAVVSATAKSTSLPLDVHLMIERPDHYLSRFIEAASSITVHVEARHDVASTLKAIRSAGRMAGLAISPATPFSAAEPFAPFFDILLVMTVVPGFGGQPFLPDMADKVRQAADFRARNGLDFHIEVDGGIRPDTASLCRNAGANIMVAGTSVFSAADAAGEITAIRGPH
ncbi:MAG: ribulose-phosphate 3-epimerase [Terrimicrobiaceae bacterium]